MREDPADKAEIHAFRGVSGSISWLAAGQTRPDVSCQLSNLQQTLPQLTVAQVCASSMVVRRVHQYADLGLKIRRTPARCVIEQWRSGWLTGRLHLWCSRQVIAGGRKGAGQCRARWVRKHKPCLWLWALSSEQRCFCRNCIRGPFDLQGAPAVMQERPPVCVTDCKSLYDHLSAVGSPSTLQDKRSAIDVLIIRESVKKTGCVIRWAPTVRQLVDGHTKDKGEAVECLRRRLRSGSYNASV